MKAKTKAPALSFYFNTIENKPVDSGSPFKRGVCLKVFTTTPKKPNFHGPAGDIARDHDGEIGMIAGDIVDALADAFYHLAQ